jgi:hypothetical protein
VFEKKIPLKAAYPVAILVFVAAVAIAYACLKWYDEPVRALLNKKAKAPVKVKQKAEAAE